MGVFLHGPAFYHHSYEDLILFPITLLVDVSFCISRITEPAYIGLRPPLILDEVIPEAAFPSYTGMGCVVTAGEGADNKRVYNCFIQ